MRALSPIFAQFGNAGLSLRTPHAAANEISLAPFFEI